jgi:hypothetical protein
MAFSVNGIDVIDADGVLKIASGTTAERPDSPVIGMIFFNTDTPGFEGYDGSEWGAIGGAGGGEDTTARTLALLALG